MWERGFMEFGPKPGEAGFDEEGVEFSEDYQEDDSVQYDGSESDRNDPEVKTTSPYWDPEV